MLPLPIMLALACDPGGQAFPVSNIDLPATVVVSDAPIGRLTSGTFIIRNMGTADAAVSLSADAPFRASDAPIEVPAGGEVEGLVEFVPEEYAEARGELTVRSEHLTYTTEIVGLVDFDADSDGSEAAAAGGTDCDDDNDQLGPHMDEVCDGIDQDCDGIIDNNSLDALEWHLDSDADGFGGGSTIFACTVPSGFTDVTGDCDDSRADTWPGATEVAYDGIDQDCDGWSDYDVDRDGFDSDLHGGTDCDDGDADIQPGAVDTIYDGVDTNCDGLSDFDADLDGFDSDAFGGNDCDDADDTFNPSAPEIDDGLDQDCDGLKDEDFVLRGDLLFTEVLVLPDSGSTAGQYVEVYNASARSADLTGARLISASSTETLGTVIIAPGQVALFCGSTTASANGGLVCEWELPGILATADGIRLFLEKDVDEVNWVGWSNTQGVSWELLPAFFDADDNDVQGNWCDATSVIGNGNLGTPGTVSSPCP